MVSEIPDGKPGGKLYTVFPLSVFGADSIFIFIFTQYYPPKAIWVLVKFYTPLIHVWALQYKARYMFLFTVIK